MIKIMACTVASPTPRNEVWASLQSTFLDRTKFAEVHKHVVINGASPVPWLDNGYKIISHWAYNKGHLQGLRSIIDNFKVSECDWLLILDSDAWPIRDDWFAICDKLMSEKGKEGCAAIRCENFDIFPHPCIFLANKSLINRGAEFDLRTDINLLGNIVTDLAVSHVDFDNYFIPLLRSNKVNHHPLFGGIYNHLFYHHGAGSRLADLTRVGMSGMHDHYISNTSHAAVEAAMYSSLSTDPKSYLNKLIVGVAL